MAGFHETGPCYPRYIYFHHHIQRRNSRFFIFLQSPHYAANRLQHVCSSSPGTIVCKSRATHWALTTCSISCYMPRGTNGHLSYLEWQSWNHIYLNFILLAEPLNRRRGGGGGGEGGEETGVPGENPWWRASENATHYSLKIQAPSET